MALYLSVPNLSPFARIRQLVQYLFGVTPDDMPAVCQLPGCTIVVPPFEGVRRGGMVFCSAEHDAEQQEEEL